MLAFGKSKFEEDINGLLFGRLVEAKVAGIPVPNPKKAFMGRALRELHDPHSAPSDGDRGDGIRMVFVSCHFPVAQLAATLEETGIDQLQAAKVAFAKSLRRILVKCSRRNAVDHNTVLFLQGDLNSRTVLRNCATDNEFTVE